MSYYGYVWKETQRDLGKCLLQEGEVRKKEPIKDAETAKWLIGRIFLGYIRIVNKLDECYEHMTHPQKRYLIRTLMDMTLGRLLEIKRDIVTIELDDYVFFDNILMELKITPEEMEIKIPKYYWRDREKSKAHQRELIKEVYEEMREEAYKAEYLSTFPKEERKAMWEKYLEQKKAEKLERQKQEEVRRKRGVIESEVEVKHEEEHREITKAIILLQRHERARQARSILAVVKSKIRRKDSSKKDEETLSGEDEKSELAAVIIQRHWRRHRKRILGKRRLEKEMLLLGMIEPSWRDPLRFKNLEDIKERKRKIQERNQEEYDKTCETIKERLTTLYSVYMNEDITDEIRAWFKWYLNVANNFPDYPPEEQIFPTGEILGIPKIIPKEFVEKYLSRPKGKMALPKSTLALSLAGIRPIGGTALVVAGHWIEPTQFLMVQKELERYKKDRGSKGKKLSKEEKAAIKKKEREMEKLRMRAQAIEGFRTGETNFLLALQRADTEYRNNWRDLDESENYDQRCVKEFIKEEKCCELSMQVRQVVDEAMRIELELLKDALEKDRNPKKKRKRKRKKPKGKKKKPPKIKKDLTSNRTVDELFSELFKNGIIKECEEAHLKDFYGERAYTAFESRRKLEDGRPSLGDVRDVILQLCILPLGSSRIHQLAPLNRSICLIGPEHSGKEFLARIVCTETASVLFDLTPKNTAGKYTSKNALTMLIHMVEKMSRILQPSIILVDGTEKLFYKKVPKDEKMIDPKRLGKSLTKIVKAISKEDQILVLGISSFPWLARKSKLTKTYERFINMPRPDYGTYFFLWRNLLIPYHSLDRDFDFSCLAKVSAGYPIKVIIEVVKKVMTLDRIARNRVDPYKPVDFIQELSKCDRTENKWIEKNNRFYDKTDIRKKRLERLQDIQLVQKSKTNKK